MSTAHRTGAIPAGKVPLDYLMYMGEVKSKDLAEAAGVSLTEVSRWRRGMRPIHAEQRKKVAKFLKVTQVELGWEAEKANV
jgi:transcriptional regulator with XRE-family HTH domain